MVPQCLSIPSELCYDLVSSLIHVVIQWFPFFRQSLVYLRDSKHTLYSGSAQFTVDHSCLHGRSDTTERSHGVADNTGWSVLVGLDWEVVKHVSEGRRETVVVLGCDCQEGVSTFNDFDSVLEDFGSLAAVFVEMDRLLHQRQVQHLGV